METNANEDQPLNFSKSAREHQNPTEALATVRKEDCVLKLPIFKNTSNLFIPPGIMHQNYIQTPFVAAAAVSAAMTAATCRQITHSISSSRNIDSNLVPSLSALSSPLSSQCSSNTPTLLCAVCGDVSSGKHYGILACNGCSGFFKRSVRRRLIYRCQAGTGSCVVDKTHRNQCQACRLRKCLSKGMNRDAVQNERQPRSTATIRIADDASNSETAFSTLLLSQTKPTGFNSNCIKDSPEQKYYLDKNCTVEEYKNNESVYEMATKILYISVKWVKNFSSLSTLPMSDQLLCLEEAWCDLFLMSLIQWSTSTEKRCFLTNAKFPGKEQLQSFEEVFCRIKAMDVSQDEFACLKTLLLLNPGLRGLKKPIQIQELQDRVQQSLLKCSSQFSSARFGRLLLVLPQLRVVSRERVEETLFMPVFGNNSVVKVICSMYRGKQHQ